MKHHVCVGLAFLLLAGCGSPSAKGPARSGKQGATQVSSNRIDQGVHFLQANDPKSAVESFVEYVKENPQDLRGYLILGETYMRLRNYPRAVDTLSAAAQIAPDNGQPYYLIAMTYAMAGDSEKARQFAERSLDLFRQKKDAENFRRALVFLQSLAAQK